MFSKIKKLLNQKTSDDAVLQIRQLADKANFYQERGQYSDAEPLFRQALTTSEQAFGANSLETSVILNNLAVLYKYMASFDDAQELYRRALQITESELGSEHTELATIYHN